MFGHSCTNARRFAFFDAPTGVESKSLDVTKRFALQYGSQHETHRNRLSHMAGRKAHMVAIPRGNTVATIWAIAAIGVLVIVMVSLPMAGTRPYGEQAILDQILYEDSALCSKFGITPATQKFSGCLIDLADLRQRHVELLNAWGWL